MAAAATAALAACGGAPGLQDPTGRPYVRGPIESIDHRATTSGIVVGGGPGSVEPCGISATVDSRTRVLERAPSGALRELTIAALGVGDTMEVFVDGPVAESCPVQGRASAMVRVASGG